MLTELSEIFLKAFDKSFLVKSTTSLWNDTFAKSNHLVYPQNLKEYFKKNAFLKLILPNWHQQTVLIEEIGSREIQLDSQVIKNKIKKNLNIENFECYI